MSLTTKQMARYRRQVSLSGFGAAAQEKLLEAHVVVIGAGGLGSPALLYLAGAGVGHITLVDDDTVALSNLHRQVIHSAGDIGARKVDSARAAMLALNPDITVDVVTERLSRANAPDLVAGADVVLDGSDNFATRYLTSWACARAPRPVPHVWASILGFDAQMSVFWAEHGPIYEDLFPAPPPAGSVPSCSEAGVLGPVVGTVGSAMALEALKLLSGAGTPLIGTVGYFSALDGTWEYFPVTARSATLDRVRAGGPLLGDPAAVATGSTDHKEDTDMNTQVKEVDDIPEGALIVDVREPEEVAEVSIPGSVHMPLGEVQDGKTPEGIEEALNDDRPVVVHCAGGVRSAKAVDTLQSRGLEGPLYSLRGGINGWLEKQN